MVVKGKTVISISAKALIITSLFYWSLGIIHTTRGFLNGAGDTNYALVNGMAEVICRIVFSLILTRIAFIGYWGHMVHHRRNMVCDRYGEPYKIQGWKMEASCHSEIDFHNCCTDWVRQFF